MLDNDFAFSDTRRVVSDLRVTLADILLQSSGFLIRKLAFGVEVGKMAFVFLQRLRKDAVMLAFFG